MTSRVLIADGLHAVGQLDNVVVMFGLRPPSATMVEQMLGQMRGVVRQHPSGIGFILVMAPPEGITLPSGEIRQAQGAMAALLDELSGHIKGAAIVLDRKGFLGATLRAGVTGVLLLRRQKINAKVVASPDEGISWLLQALAEQKVSVPNSDAIWRLLTELSSKCSEPAH